MSVRNHEADQWQDFHSKFRQLAVEEAKIRRAEGRDYLLAAYTYGVSLPVKGELEQGPFCPFPAPEFGLWGLGGMNENFQERFRTLATRAGAALGCLQGTDRLNFWLHRLFLYLRERHSEELLVPKGGELWTPKKGGRGKELLAATQGGMIRRVCVTSATFCSWLERKALETSASSLRPDANPTNARKRKSFVSPILASKGWSILDWASNSDVDFNTANNYLKGKTKPYESTRAKLAKSLGVEVQKLPG